VTFRFRLIATSLVTLVVGVGAILVAGNALRASRFRSETTRRLIERPPGVSRALDRAGTSGRRAVLDARMMCAFSSSRWARGPAVPLLVPSSSASPPDRSARFNGTSSPAPS
jgi:hypothetical protein